MVAPSSFLHKKGSLTLLSNQRSVALLCSNCKAALSKLDQWWEQDHFRCIFFLVRVMMCVNIIYLIVNLDQDNGFGNHSQSYGFDGGLKFSSSLLYSNAHCIAETKVCVEMTVLCTLRQKCMVFFLWPVGQLDHCTFTG